MNRTSLGLDLSTAATGVVLLRETPEGPPVTLSAYEIKPKGLKGIALRRTIVTEIMQSVHALKPDVIVLEGYGLNLKNASAIVPLVELGGLMRFCLHIDGLEWFAPTPGECKKFATGKGNSPKDVVMMHVLKRWKYEPATNNVADAYVCAAMGLAKHEALAGLTKDMASVISGMAALSN